ncbi:MAG: hypothetical protein KDD35_05195 [Bdellovibrionales bacterium]|nr:hypothetical protein [Bdellovibrionales bacterium]
MTEKSKIGSRNLSKKIVSDGARFLVTAILTLSQLACSTLAVTINGSSQDRIQLKTESLFDSLKALDSDGDKKLTIQDKIPQKAKLTNARGDVLVLKGVYPLSILWQEVSLAKEKDQEFLEITKQQLLEPPLFRAEKLIRDSYWDELTRRLDRDGILAMYDSKTDEGSSQQNQLKLRLYIPHSDKQLLTYYRSFLPYWRSHGVKVDLIRLPQQITPGYVRQLDGRHGVLSLGYEGSNGQDLKPLPFVVPGGRFNEMYGWDSYFIALGLIESGKLDLAKSMVDNFVYQIEHYGKILNANRSYYLTRSQPPFTTSMIRAVFDQLKPNEQSKEWLRKSIRSAMKEYREVWMAVPRLDPKTGLSRYYGEGLGPCPEVEVGHYDEVMKPFVGTQQFSKAKNSRELIELISKSLIANPQLNIRDPNLREFFIHDRTMRESGHDTTYRWHDRAADFLTVDLNTLLFKTESDFLALLESGDLPEGGEFGSRDFWRKALEQRKAKMNKFLWNDELGFYFDWDLKNNVQSDFISATGFYPLWAGVADQAMAERAVKFGLSELEQAGGVASTALSSLKKYNYPVGQRQWDYPNAWAPHQILIWQGLLSYGHKSDALRLAQKWRDMIEMGIRDYNGTIPEKYDVVDRTHKVFAEYGNVGTDFSYITKEGFGWMNTSILLSGKILEEGPRID